MKIMQHPYFLDHRLKYLFNNLVINLRFLKSRFKNHHNLYIGRNNLRSIICSIALL